jgi:hypothetical protein
VVGLRLGGLTDRTLTPRQTTHVKEALLKEDISIAHAGYKRKTIIAETPSHQSTLKHPPEAPTILNNNTD